MFSCTSYQIRYFAEQLALKRPQSVHLDEHLERAGEPAVFELGGRLEPFVRVVRLDLEYFSKCSVNNGKYGKKNANKTL